MSYSVVVNLEVTGLLMLAVYNAFSLSYVYYTFNGNVDVTTDAFIYEK